MSDFLKNAPKKTLSDTAKQQWDLDTSPADIPDDIVEWRRTHKQKEVASAADDLANASAKPAAIINLAKTKNTRAGAKVDSQPDSDLNSQSDSQVDSQKTRSISVKPDLAATQDAHVDSQVNTDLDSRLDSQPDSVNSTANPTVNLDAKVDSQPDSDPNSQSDSQIDSQFIAQQTITELHVRDWQRILDLGDKAILECLWINRRTEIDTRILNYEELSKYSKIPYGTVRYRLRRLRSHMLIDTWKRGAIGKLKGNIYRLNRENIAQAIPLLVQQDIRLMEGRTKHLDSQLDSQVDSRLNTRSPLSSSSISTTTTGEGDDAQKLPVDRATVVEQLRQEIIFSEWDGLDVTSLVRYVFRDGKWIHSISELQDFLDKAAAAVEYSKKTKSPISSALGFLHSCLAKWSVDTPPGYESRQERALRFRLEEEKRRLENLKRLNQELAVTRFKTFVAEQKPEKIKELRESAKEAGKTAPVGGKRVERHHYVSSLVDLFFEKEIVEGITKDALLDVPDLI